MTTPGRLSDRVSDRTTPDRAAADRIPEWLPDALSIGMLATAFPSDLVDAVIDEAGARERRYRTLPARFMVYYVLALAMFAPKGYVEVMCLLTRGLSWLRDCGPDWDSATVPAIAKARSRLGEEPLALLFDHVSGPIAEDGTDDPGQASPGQASTAWRGLRLVTAEEVVFEVPDTAENTAAFGGAVTQAADAGGDRPGAPKARIVALGEARTGALLGAAFGPAAHPGTPLASRVAAHLNETTLLLVGETFPVGALWQDAIARGAQLAWQVTTPVTLPVAKVLADGTWLTELPETWALGGSDTTVRVIECESRTPSGRPAGKAFALLTTMTDPAKAPAEELLAAYETRWRGEVIPRSLMACSPGLSATLRSRSPDTVRQEIWAMLCVYQRVRDLMWHAAHALRLDEGPSLTPRTHGVRRRRADSVVPQPRAELTALSRAASSSMHGDRTRYIGYEFYNLETRDIFTTGFVGYPGALV